jgi:tyrosine-protein kinase Etk/Wzc
MPDNSQENINEPMGYAAEESDELSLQDLLSILWDGKWLLMLVALAALAIGIFYTWIATPIYKVDALVQIEEESSGSSALFSDLGDLLETASPADAEIEIIKSRLTLGRVVEILDLHIRVAPETLPVVGDALIRKQLPEIVANMPRISTLELPTALLGKTLVIEKKGKNDFVVLDGDREVLGGTVGKSVEGELYEEPHRIFVSRFKAPAGERYLLTGLSALDAIEDIKNNLSVEEKGKQSGVLSLSYTDPDPARGAGILNEICTQYLRQNVERSSEEAEKTLTFLREQLPDLKQKMEIAEENLNAYRYEAGTVDLGQEATLMLDQSVAYEAKIFEMEQKREELLRLFKANHPTIKAVEAQIEQLQKEVDGLEASVKKLPKTQQEILRLSRDVQVNTELYTTLLNNAQQLQVAKAGEIGSVRIIDRAMATSRPIKPKKTMLWALALIIGMMAGAGIVLLKRLWDKGIEDPKVIEERFGLPVYATVPHSSRQDALDREMRKKKNGLHVLAHQGKDDLAVESFRSLRTTLHFSMLDAPNNIVMLAGSCPNIGKTFVSTNFAAILAQSGKKVLLIDADMRKGHINHYLGLDRKCGLSDALAATTGVQEVVKKTDIDNLWFISTGQLPPNPSELLLQERFTEFLEDIRTDFDYVVIDAPPILAVTDSVIIGKQAGTTLLLLKHRYHPMGEVETSIRRLEHAGVNLKGVVFNDVVYQHGRYGHKYGQYVYQYKYGGGKKGK